MGIFKVLAIDPALANVGWILLNFDLDYQDRFPKTPSWFNEGDHGISTYNYFRRLDGGTYETNNSVKVNERLVAQIDLIHFLVAIHKPDILAFESQLEVGMQRCTWGVALQLGLIFPYFKARQRSVRLARCPEMDVQDSLCRDTHKNIFNHIDHIPNWGIAIKPPQLQSIAQHEKKTTGSVIKKRYKEISGYTQRCTEHEADAYFIGVHAGRFWASCLKDYWSQDILTSREMRIFLDPEKGVLFREYESWFSNVLEI